MKITLEVEKLEDIYSIKCVKLSIHEKGTELREVFKKFFDKFESERIHYNNLCFNTISGLEKYMHQFYTQLDD